LANGTISFTGDVCIGNYTVTEIAAPPGYLIDPADVAGKPCNVADTGVPATEQQCSVTFKDFRGSILIRKEAKDHSDTNAADPFCPGSTTTRCPLNGPATFQVTPDPTDGTHTCPNVTGSCLQVTDNGTGDANPTLGLICIDNVSQVPGNFKITESAAPPNYAKAAPQTGITASDSNCANHATSAGSENALFVNTPLTTFEGICTAQATGVSGPATNCTINCDFSGGFVSGPIKDVDQIYHDQVPGTYQCTVVIDP
jgi:hypothetical protein